MSFALVIGILVAGQTHTFPHRAVKAQTESPEVTTLSSLSIGTTFQIRSGEVVSPVIYAYGVSVDGVPTDFVLGSKLAVVGAYIVGDGVMSINGVIVSGSASTTPKDGVIVSGSATTTPKDGVIVSGSASTTPKDGVIVSGNLEETEPTGADFVIMCESAVQVTGGALVGTDIRIVDGVVYGNDLRVVGATVSGGGLSLSSVDVTSPGS